MIRHTIPLLLLLMSAPGAFAEGGPDDFARGRAEYMAACAACHGDKADGDGPIASMFRAPVPGLRTLSRQNDGEFPFLKVFHIVDGRTEIRAHGNPMPIFGNRYRAEVGDQAMPFTAELFVRGRVLELVSYIQSIQE